MMSIVLLPILIPFAGAILSLALWKRRRLLRIAGVGGALATAASGALLLATVLSDGIVSVQVSGWQAPFGITVVADTIAAILTMLTGLTGVVVAVYSLSGVDAPRERHGFHFFFHTLLMGVNGAFLTGDLFNLYVWFEVLLISSFVLLALGGEKPQLEGAFKYVTLNLIASTMFLAAAGMTYSIAGTLNMADLHAVLSDPARPGLVTAVSMFFLVAFGVKAAMFPLFFWLPASYHTPPPAISALFAGLLTKVGVYAMLRVYTLVFTHESETISTIILTLSGVTMLAGVLGAAVQTDVRRILAFHSVSQVGYMLMGIGLQSPAALAGSIVFLVHHNIVKSNLFLIAGIGHELRGSFALKELGGLMRSAPWLSVLFFLTAFSLAGIPPLSGFWAKVQLIIAGVEARSWLIVTAALVTGMITLFSMTKIWASAYWSPDPRVISASDKSGMRVSASMLGPVVLLTLLTVGTGFLAEPLIAVAQRAALEITDPAPYIDAVIRGRP